MHGTPSAPGSDASVAAEMSTTPVTAPAGIKQIWRQARRSLTFGLLIASGYAFCFWALATQMPRLPVRYQSITTLNPSAQLGRLMQSFSMQASDLSALKAFPPRTVPGIIALRDLVKQYAASFPVRLGSFANAT